MRVFLDDERQTPEGWVRTYSVEETIRLLETGKVTHVSLDNDLGDDVPEGYLVADWLDERSFLDPTYPVPVITVHSSNAARLDHMRRAIEAIQRRRNAP
jgi:hypothetical protein